MLGVPYTANRYDKTLIRQKNYVTHLALLVFVVMKRFQHVVTQAKNCYNLGIHVASWLCYGFATTTLPEGAWTF